MKKKFFLYISLFLIVLFSLVGYYNYEINNKKLYNTTIKIDKNQSLRQSLSAFPEAQSLIFKIYLKFRNNGKGIKAGLYELQGEYSIKDILNILEKGQTKFIKITIPEGYTVNQIAQLLVSYNINTMDFYKALNNASKNFPYLIPKGNFEGYLYPETYYFDEGFTAKDVVGAMLQEFMKKFPPENYSNKDEFYQKLIMASILEREAMIQSEKPIMASVFYNRMAKNMTLSSDATVNYVYDYTKKRMLYKDLEIDSPYNTYKYKGLPPAPICNPRLNSVEAAYNPSKTEYLFFVAKGDGSHYFSKTYKEHLRFQLENKKTK